MAKKNEAEEKRGIIKPGKRKVWAFFTTTFLFFIVYIFTLIIGLAENQNLKLTEMFEIYVIVQGVIAGGFFGFNFGEHWADAKKGTAKPGK